MDSPDSLEVPDDYSQDACQMTTAVEMEWAAVISSIKRSLKRSSCQELTFSDGGLNCS